MANTPAGRLDYFDEHSTTARDLAPYLVAFNEPFNGDVRGVVDENWPEIVEELRTRSRDEDVVVLLSDARETWPPRRLPYLMHSVVPRATAIALALVVDVQVADWLSQPRDPGGIDVVVELGGDLTALHVEHPTRAG
jgi:hypothetical protein